MAQRLRSATALRLPQCRIFRRDIFLCSTHDPQDEIVRLTKSVAKYPEPLPIDIIRTGLDDPHASLAPSPA